MIELKDLRQGNWVIAGLDKQPVQVAEILADSVNTTLLKNWTPEIISPIPLSPEILIKMGFESCSCGGWKNGKYGKLIHLDRHMVFDDYIVVESLHHLQNIVLDLTKKELIYKP